MTITKNDDSCMCSAVLHDTHNIIPPMQYNAIHAMPMQCHVLLCSGILIIIQDLTILDMVCSLILFIICGVYRWEKVYRYIYIYI